MQKGRSVHNKRQSHVFASIQRARKSGGRCRNNLQHAPVPSEELALRAQRCERHEVFFLFSLKKILLSGYFFQTKQIRADTSHKVSALLVIFVFAKKYYCYPVKLLKFKIFLSHFGQLAI